MDISARRSECSRTRSSARGGGSGGGGSGGGGSGSGGGDDDDGDDGVKVPKPAKPTSLSGRGAPYTADGIATAAPHSAAAAAAPPPPPVGRPTHSATPTLPTPTPAVESPAAPSARQDRTGAATREGSGGCSAHSDGGRGAGEHAAEARASRAHATAAAEGLQPPGTVGTGVCLHLTLEMKKHAGALPTTLAAQAARLHQLTRTLRDAPDVAAHYYQRACTLLTMKMYSEVRATLGLSPRAAAAPSLHSRLGRCGTCRGEWHPPHPHPHPPP